MGRIGRAFDPFALGSDDLGWAIARQAGRLSRLAIDFDDLSIIDIGAEGILDCVEVGSTAVGRKLDSVGEARFQILHEEAGGTKD